METIKTEHPFANMPTARYQKICSTACCRKLSALLPWATFSYIAS